MPTQIVLDGLLSIVTQIGKSAIVEALSLLTTALTDHEAAEGVQASTQDIPKAE